MRVAPVLIRPMAADDVAGALADVAVGQPVNGIVEIAGPEQFRFDELVRRTLTDRGDPREVVTDPHARYFGAELEERSLVPAAGARLAETRLDHGHAWVSAGTWHPVPEALRPAPLGGARRHRLKRRRCTVRSASTRSRLGARRGSRWPWPTDVQHPLASPGAPRRDPAGGDV